MAAGRVAVAAWVVALACGTAGLSAASAPSAAPAWAAGPTPASQQQDPAAGCRGRIDIIRWDLKAIYSAGAIGGDRPLDVYEALDGKLVAARAALDDSRQHDAMDRLREFEAMVILLRDAAPARLSSTDAQRLLFGDSDRPIDEGVNGAIICVWLMDWNGVPPGAPGC